MNKSKAVKAAIAFKRGMAFVRGMQQLAQDADVPEGARWITIGAHKNEDGESSGGRHVLIDKESGTILKGLSKDVQGKTLNEAFKELKKTDGKKGEKNDQIFRSMPRKEFADMFRSTGGDELSENNTLKIWYKDHTFKHFDYESDRKELARALRQPGIKAIAWSNEGDVGYYGSPNDIVMRNVNTNETKPLAEVQKDAGVGSLWVVDDVIDSTEKKAAEQKAAEEKKAAEQKAAEEKKAAAEKKAAGQKAAAEKKAAEQKAAEQKAAEKYPYWENGKRYGYTYVPSDFWDKWKINKQAIKDAGIQPTKIDGEWKLKVFEGADPKVLDGIKTEKEKASEAQEKARSEAIEKIKELRADNLPTAIFNPGEVAAVDQFAYERKEVEQDYNALKDKRNKLKADIAEESARLEKEGQKTSGALTKMENELEAIRKKIKEHAFSFSAREAQDRFFGEGNYKPGKYGHIRHVIDRDTVILNVAESSVRNTRYGTLLNISHDMMIDVPGFGIKPIRIKTGDDHWEDGYAVKIKRQYYSPKALNNPTDNAAFKETPTFDDIVRAAKAQDLDQNTTVKVRTIK